MVKRMLSVAIVATVAAGGSARAQDGTELASISAETARHRIGAVLAKVEPDAEDLRALAEIAERCADPGVGAVAAYNAGTIAMRLGEADAAAWLRRAESGTADPSLRARSRFNLAHAVMPNQEEPPADIAAADARIAALREAAGLFRSVLDLEPGHAEAAANTERVRRMIRDLMEERARMEAAQQAREELAEQLEQLARQQEQRAQESQGRGERGEPSPESEGSEQRALNEQTERASEQAERSGAGDEAQEAIERARRAQEQAEEALGRGDSAEAADRQREAAEALREAAEAMRRAEGRGDDAENAQGQGEEAPIGESEATRAEAGRDGAEAEPRIDPLAEALLDKERREREQRGQYLQRGRRQQVERDW